MYVLPVVEICWPGVGIVSMVLDSPPSINHPIIHAAHREVVFLQTRDEGGEKDLMRKRDQRDEMV